MLNINTAVKINLQRKATMQTVKLNRDFALPISVIICANIIEERLYRITLPGGFKEKNG